MSNNTFKLKSAFAEIHESTDKRIKDFEYELDSRLKIVDKHIEDLTESEAAILEKLDKLELSLARITKTLETVFEGYST